jgi:transposase-like protein
MSTRDNDNDDTETEVMTRRRAAPIKRPQHVRDEAVKRHLEGQETVKSLCKFYKVSRATMYNWIEGYKRDIVEAAKRQGIAPRDLDRTAKSELVAQNEILQTENRKLRDRLVALMVKHNEIP